MGDKHTERIQLSTKACSLNSTGKMFEFQELLSLAIIVIFYNSDRANSWDPSHLALQLIQNC